MAPQLGPPAAVASRAITVANATAPAPAPIATALQVRATLQLEQPPQIHYRPLPPPLWIFE